MTKVFVFSAFVLAFCLAETSFAAKICLQDNFGNFWELKGGKIDKKSYTFTYIAGTCIMAGTAEVTATDSGSFILAALSGPGTTGVCNSILWSATVDASFSGIGSWDALGDGTIGGTFTLLPINCSTLPSTLMDNTPTVDPNNPILGEQ